MSDDFKKEVCERITKLETQRETESVDCRDTRSYIYNELRNMSVLIIETKEWVKTAITEIKESFRICLYGNGKPEDSLDGRVKKLEGFMHTWDWRKAAVGRIIAAIIQALLILWGIHYLGPK